MSCVRYTGRPSVHLHPLNEEENLFWLSISLDETMVTKNLASEMIARMEDAVRMTRPWLTVIAEEP